MSEPTNKRRARQWGSVAVLLLAFALGSIQGQDVGPRVLSVNGYGVRAVSRILQAWGQAYQFDNNVASVTYEPAKSSLDAIAAISSKNSPILHGNIDYFYKDTAQAAGLLTLSYFFYGTTFPFRLDGVEGEVPVYLSEDLLCKVYLGRVSQWDDAAIQDLNPDVRLPSTAVRPIIYNESTSANIILSTACSAMLGEEWNSSVTPSIGPVTSYPIDDDAGTLSVNDDPAALLDLINSTDGAIGFGLGPDVWGYPKREIILKRYDNTSNSLIPVAHSGDTLQLAVQSFDQVFRDSPSITGQITNSADPTAWPFAASTLGIVKPSSFALRCEDAVEWTSFVQWGGFNEAARSLANQMGFGMISTAMRTRVRRRGSLSCNGQTANQIPTINVLGAVATAPLFRNWVRTAPSVLGNTMTIDFDSSPEADVTTALAKIDVEFTVTLDYSRQPEYETTPGLLQVPAAGSGLAIVVNIPNITDDSNLTFNADVLAGIYSGAIARWNDASILALNPLLAGVLPDQPINVMVRTDSNTDTRLFTRTLAKMINQKNVPDYNPRWNDIDYVAWPIPASRMLPSDYSHTTDTLSQNLYSIGYSHYSLIVLARNLNLAPGTAIARIVNSAGNPVTPVASNVLSAINNSVVKRYDPNLADGSSKRASEEDDNNLLSLYGDLSAAPGQTSYPFSTFMYYNLRRDTHDSTCFIFAKELEWIAWTLSWRSGVRL
eukprot:TRINITY_DN1257_c0_g2_i1.p1 TRINITY_DN1257_c0_g2~~TRINITY_DN1257_c0_g2_i1.p1  ORF type:complete len:716 (+),score=63.38 TRINITY_DN1257_c0_g2_i1:41-2188(+)